MPVDLLEKSRVNIRNLVLPESRPRVLGLLFNPEAEITTSDQQEIEKDFKSVMEKTEQNLEFVVPSFNALTTYYLAAKTLFPQITTRIPLSKPIWSVIGNRLKFERQQLQPNYFDLAATLKLTFPGQKIQGLITADIDKKRLSSLILDSFAVMKISQKDTFNKMKAYKILFPESDPFADVLKMRKEGSDWYLRELREDGKWQEFAQSAADLKILDPGYSPVVQISGGDWETMKENLIDHSRRTGQWGVFTVNAMNLTILAATDVNISEHGLEITMPKSGEKLDEGRHTLPSVRKF